MNQSGPDSILMGGGVVLLIERDGDIQQAVDVGERLADRYVAKGALVGNDVLDH